MKNLSQLVQALLTALILFGVAGSMSVSRAQETATASNEPSTLSAKEILYKVRQAYAGLSTYRDTGWTVQHYKDDAWTNTFTELLGPRTRYRVEVVTAAHPYSQTNRFWCDGIEHRFQSGGPTVFRGMDLAGNLLDVSDETSIPAVYFLLSWGNIFTPLNLGPDTELIRKPDEAVGGELCYVVARTTAAHPATIWVGNRDFLIRRCQTSGRIETHENISTNEQFQASDFLPLNAGSNP